MARFGWCLDGLHERCKGVLPSAPVSCTCSCHDPDQPDQLDLTL